ncbi:MAG: RNA polymerase sigma factor [Flavisolibacter sp.]
MICIIRVSMPLMTEKFIDNCIKGDPKAQKQLFEQLYAPLYRVCLRYINHKEDAEDCLMKGFLKAFQNIHRFSYTGEGSFQGWIRRIMVNECLMFLRKKSSLLFYPEEEPIQCSLPAEVLLKIEAEALNALVMQLPVGYRTIFNLFAVEGYSHKEIADLLGVTESTSKSQFSKARMKLKLLLEQKKSVVYGKLGE